MKEVLMVILDQYADWEAAHIAAAIGDSASEYVVKTVSLEKEPVQSIGGFRVLPDYDLSSIPEEFAALLLIGGYSWRKKEAVSVAGLVQHAADKGILIGAICDATVYLGMHGFLNEVQHTSNTQKALKEAALENYIGEKNYLMQQAVSDKGFITANGSAYLEFAKEVLLALKPMTPEKIEEWYDYYKLGLYEALQKWRSEGKKL